MAKRGRDGDSYDGGKENGGKYPQWAWGTGSNT